MFIKPYSSYKSLRRPSCTTWPWLEHNEFMTMFYIQATPYIYSEMFFKIICNAIKYFYCFFKGFAAWIKKIIG